MRTALTLVFACAIALSAEARDFRDLTNADGKTTTNINDVHYDDFVVKAAPAGGKTDKSE